MNDGSWLSPSQLGPAAQMTLLMSVLSLAPAILMMTTCFVRISIVLGLLRQALGTQIPSNPVLTGLGLFLTAAVMQPVWQASYEQGIKPYTTGKYETPVEQERALRLAAERTAAPLRRFMSRQLQASQNSAVVDLLLEYHQTSGAPVAEYRYYEDLPWGVLLPAFMLSELKTAFVIGVQIYLPFVVIDLLCGALLSAAGLSMVPPSWTSTPLKLFVFVLIDGWTLVTRALLSSLAPF